MFFHYTRNLFRNFQKQKANALINILGLALGVGVTLLIWVFLLHELSYDRFWEHHDRIYRIHTEAQLGRGNPLEVPTTFYPITELAMREIPEIENAVRFTSYFMNPAFSYEDRSVNLPGIIFSDSTFFELFSIEFIAGNRHDALTDPGSLVLTESSAQLLFTDPLDALYRVVQIQEENFHVTGIIKDLPENTHLSFSALGSEAFLPEQIKISGTNFYSYLLLHPAADPSKVEEKLYEISNRHIAENPLYEGLLFETELRLMPVSDIHLRSGLMWEMRDNGSIRTVYFFAFLSVFILFVAIINYINLATARSTLRAKEIGIRKVSGAHKATLIRQVMAESFVVSLVAFILAFLLTEFMTGIFSRIFDLYLQTSLLFRPEGIFTIAGFFILTVILSGLYPAFYLSAIDTIKTIRGEPHKGKKGQAFRRILVVSQFAITIFVISSLMVITRQMNYIRGYDLGFDREQVLVIRNVSTRLAQSYASLKAELESHSRIESVSGSTFLFDGNNRIDLVVEDGVSKESGVTCEIIYVDHDFLDLMDIEIIEGRNFHAGSEMDINSAFILNQKAVDALGFQDPLNKTLDLFGVTGPLIGVTNNFHFKSLHQTIEPLAMLYFSSGFPQLYLKVTPGDMPGLHHNITVMLQNIDPSYVPDIEHLEQTINMAYHQENQTAGLLSAGTILAVIIALLGVYGLAAFSAERRTKETGIRIILGAGLNQLLWTFNRESVMLVSIALLVAVPLSWIAMDQWLGSFAYRITINPLWFLFSGFVVLLMSSTIISVQTWIVKRSNPVHSLRSE